MQAKKRSNPETQPFQLSLRIRHPTMDPAELSREFKITAEHFYRAGDPRPVRSGSAAATAHTESYWLGALDPATLPPDISFPGYPKFQIAAEHLRATANNSFSWALSFSANGFFRKHAPLLRRISAEGGQISLLISLEAAEVGSFSLTPEVSRALAEFAVTVEFELSND